MDGQPEPAPVSAPASAPVSVSVSVLIVDDQAPFRNAARAVVDATPGFVVAGEAEGGEAAIELAATLHPTLILMDVNMPDIDGIETTRRITERDPSATVILISTYAAADVAADVRSCGAKAYVHKEDLSPAVLLQFCGVPDDSAG